MSGLRDKLTPLLGAKTAKALAESLDIYTVNDLLRHSSPPVRSAAAS